jgi:calcineurin-like phosphoesterase family protein
VAEDVTTWYTSDTHFGHANIIKYCDRPWATADEMDAAMRERWNSVVQPEDTVYHMGDVIMNMGKLWNVEHLNGHIYLLAGNHDPVWDGYKSKKDANQSKALDRYLVAGFETVNTTGILEHHALADGQLVTLSHLPYVGDSRHGEGRYNPWRPKDSGEVNICGHVHGAWKTYGRSLNVGVDVWDFYPVHEDVVIDTIARFITNRL